MKKLLAGCLGVLFLSIAAFPHHSPVIFDRTKEVKLSGVVKGFRWTNPHSWIELNVRSESGQAGDWSIELGSPAALVKAGWKSTTIKAGDQVTIVVHPLKASADKTGQFVSLTLPSGQVLTERAAPASRP